jgi:hypothetical protein
MAKVTCKSSVRLAGLSAGLCRILTVLEELSRQATGLPDELVITSISDGRHSPNSRHYRNEALDLRSKNFPGREAKRLFRALFEHSLGAQFRVLLESEGSENEHFHVQVRKGMTYP